MSGIGAAAAPVATDQSTYFFLSYAHSAPMLEDPRLDPDKWVKVFFDDLSAAVRGQISAPDDRRVGFFDAQLSSGADWEETLTVALGNTQVFVPLYSPAYLSNSWPLGELEAFRRRLRASPIVEKYRHIVPVLWIPLPSWDQTAETREALELAGDVAGYAENGLRALCMLASYRPAYEQVLGRIATEVTRIAQRYPLPPSVVPKVAEARHTSRADAQFVVVVAAPTGAEVPVDHEAGVYAERSEQWRPFGQDQALPAAKYVASTAERLGLATHITSFADAGDVMARCPSVLLIDPWIVSDSAGEHGLALVLKRLPRWVIPLMVLNGDDPLTAGEGDRFADRVARMLQRANRPPAKRVTQLPEFVQIMPELVTEARRQYLKNAPVVPSDRPRVRRPQLGRPESSGSAFPGTEEER
ncbi:TIR-like protein FxsC [Micromonospora cremea]|uniref:FxsC C-terminal domain-containing protein n=1 Tax=Micromonospora cremea TaxID=709881 RepID=A0A1N5TR98_9ACTN|nr:TIR-like protein FxsC [Micromonospora cremea]SIM50874.1 FxsC C-terminal domain-containing protein [Micromonospora cremea]